MKKVKVQWNFIDGNDLTANIIFKNDEEMKENLFEGRCNLFIAAGSELPVVINTDLLLFIEVLLIEDIEKNEPYVI